MNAKWDVRTLAEVCKIRPPKAEARLLLDNSDLVSFAPMEDLGVDRKYFVPVRTRPLSEVAGSYTYFADGDVLLAKITPCFENGKLGIAKNLNNGIGFGSSEYIVLRPGISLCSEWLYYFLVRKSFRDAGSQRMAGAVGHKRVTKDFIDSYKIPVPSLPEQHRIVALLDEAFNGIATAKANTEKNLRNARAIFDNCLKLFFEAAKKTGKLVRLSDLATEITDGDHMPPPKAMQGVPFITIGNIKKGTRTIDFSDTFLVSSDYYDGLKANKKPQAGDILYTVTGSFGVPVLIKQNRDFCFQRHIGLIRPKVGVSSEWLYYILMSPQVLKQAGDGATGTAQKTVSLKVLRAYQVPMVPLEVQVATVEKLNSLFEEAQLLESIYKQKLAALEDLQESILARAYNGDL